jgi:hypothetical protein
MLQETAVPAGSVSVRDAEVAVPAPVLLSERVYPIYEPAATVWASAAFVRDRFGHCTVVVANDCTEFPFEALRVAVFAYAAQLAVEVALVTWTDAVALAARFPKLQVRVWLAIAHVPGPL